MAAPQGICVALDSNTLVEAPTWNRLDVDYKVTSWSIDRGRSYELDKTGTGVATIDIVDTTGAFDPTNTGGTFYGRIAPLKQAAIALQNPLTAAWSTLFRGFISSVQWVPYVTERHANVRLELVDGMAILGAAEMTADGNWGDQVVAGEIQFNEDLTTNAVQTRINKVLDQASWPSGLRQIFTGNVKLQQTRYPGRSQALNVILDAADAEFPGVSNVYVNSTGTFAFHGRLARFDPDTTATSTAWDFTRWSAGDVTAVSAGTAVVPVSPPLTVVRDDANLFTSAVATPQNIVDADVSALVSTSSSGHTAYGMRTWSAENLVTAGGTANSSATAVCKLFSNYYRDNYATPRTRVGQLTILPQRRTGSVGTATWAMMCGVDISDVVHLKTTHYNVAGSATGGGFNDDFYVEGVHYEAAGPISGGVPNVTLTLDVSPTGYYGTSPF